MNNDNIEAYSDFTKELNISTDGKGSVSRRGLARLCGVDEKAIRYLLQETLGAEEIGRKISESFAGHKFEGAEEIPDLLAAEIVFHYALLGRELAIKSLKAFTAIGFRTWGQKLLGWQALQASSTAAIPIRDAISYVEAAKAAESMSDSKLRQLLTTQLIQELSQLQFSAPAQPQPSEAPTEPFNPREKAHLKAKAWVEILETRDRWASQNGHNVFDSDVYFSQAYNEHRLYIGAWVYEIVPHISRATIARRRIKNEQIQVQLDKQKVGRPLLIDAKFPDIATFIAECLESAPDMRCAEVIDRIQVEFNGLALPSEATIRRYLAQKSTEK